MTPENLKLTHDNYKHLTTLSSASILVITTFLAKGGMKQVPLAVWAMGCLLACNICSLIMMFRLADSANDGTPLGQNGLWIGMALAGGTFLSAMGFLLFFARANFLP